MMKRFMLMLVALMFVFCTSVMAAGNDAAPPSADTQNVEEQQDSEKQDCGEKGGEEVVEAK